MLKNEGYAVGVAENGQQAINKSKTSLYDLAFVGLRLLDMDGTQLPMAMRKATPGMVKIVIAGYPSLENARGR